MTSHKGGRPPVGPQVIVRMPPELIARIDAARGDQTRAEWLRKVAADALS